LKKYNNFRFFQKKPDNINFYSGKVICSFYIYMILSNAEFPMKRKRFFVSILITFLILSVSGQNAAKLRRADCFFGVHFDLHASEEIDNAGETLTEAMVDSFLKAVKPDFIQVDCKGHPGISSYPTKVGFPVKGFEKDPLKLIRKVTDKHNVGLYVHFSGVWDGKVVKEHPGWAVVKANGEKSSQKVSFFSPYLDRYMIPQLKELSDDYRIDGAWIDGECWAVEPDYGKEAAAAWKRESGRDTVPTDKKSSFCPQYLDFTRDLFRKHLLKYINAIHAHNPAFQITSNWSYSSMMPEKVSVPVDFISGDVTPQNGVYRAAYEARCIAPQGLPWDLMAWGFSWNGGNMPMSNKSAVQLKQEAAEVIAMGGGIQFYYQQNRDLSLRSWIAPTLQELAKFCRERQPFCHKATPLPQVALLYPSADQYKNAAVPFTGSRESLQGTLYALLDNQLPVEILMEHHLLGKTRKYPLIVIPECDTIAAPLLNELRSYLKEGGSILAIGTGTALLFAREAGIASHEETGVAPSFVSVGNQLAGIRSPLLKVKMDGNREILSRFYESNDFRSLSHFPAAALREVGKGKLVTVFFNAGTAYSQYKTPLIRELLALASNELFPQRRVEVVGSHLVHVMLNTLNGKTYLHLVNVAGEHTGEKAIAYDQIPPLTDLTVSFRTEAEPVSIVLQPEGKPLNFTCLNGTASVTVPRLEIHSILEISTKANP